MNSPVRLGVSPAATSMPTGVFNQWFEASFLCAEALGCVVCLNPQRFLPVYLWANVGPPAPPVTISPGGQRCLARPSPPATVVLRPLSSQLPNSAPPTGLDECFFFNSLAVGLPYSLIFCRFWLFFVSKLLLSFFWLCEEAQCVYLRLHLSWKSFLLQTFDVTIYQT
ncbi:hypothetical protein HJG60_008649 [Phyllostomus discolor]|uniref:Uncharacterized protein n=1 Tax=Phyllostomus discolor TaxID=89673 RepID=A0A833YXC4_9CHIR|nr:hypothetical protein HJG60_008649 [Phyllostomus discolor]